MNQVSLTNKLTLSAALFWDTDPMNLDLEKNAKYIIERVLTKGLLRDWQQLMKFYGKERLKKEIVGIRYLDKVTLNFCSTFFDIPKSEFRCYNEPPSIQELWTF